MATASRRCMVFKCGKTSKDRNLSFHSFPKREDIREQWIVNIKLGQPSWTTPKCSSSKYYAICSRHFEKQYFRTMKHKFDLASRNTLKPDAIPTLYMNGQPGSCLQSRGSKASVCARVKSEDPDVADQAIDDAGSQSKKEDLQTVSYSKESELNSPNPCKSSSAPTLDNLLISISESLNTDERMVKKYPLASRRCMVVGCGSTSKDRSLSFHAFPKNLDVREQWLERIKISRPNWTSSNWPESNYYAICSRHFEASCFKTMKHDFSGTSRNTLRPDAVPSLYLTDAGNSHFGSSATPFGRIIAVTAAEGMNGVDGAVPNTPRDLLQFYPSSSQNEEYDVSCCPWTSAPISITDVHTENGNWSPAKPLYTEASTQTVSCESMVTSMQKKMTRTVRIQTQITVKKSVKNKGIQSENIRDISTDDQSTHHEANIPLCEARTGGATTPSPLSENSQDPPSQINSSNGENLSPSICCIKNGTPLDSEIELESPLVSLFKSCPLCSASSVTKVLNDLGDIFSIRQSCQNEQCRYEQLWTSQPLNGLNKCK